VPWRPDHLLCGVTYMPAEVGPYLWHEFDVERTRRDLRRISAAGFGAVRVHLAWDAFVPTPRQVDRYRLRDLESLLQIAQAASLQVVPVLFAQSFGDCVLLPRYAVARDRPWPGVRVVSDGVVERGGPRDVWSDPLMLEVESLWLEEMLRAFSNHPALLAWDLGHDPATTCRPLRIAHLESWLAIMGSRVRTTQDACWMTLGAGDVLTARGVRLHAAAPHVDALGLAVQPQDMRVTGDPLDVARVLFVLRMAQRLAAPDAAEGAALSPVVAVTGITAQPVAGVDTVAGATAARAPERTVEPAAAADAVRHAGALLERAPESGVGAVFASAWCDLGARALAAPPFDRQPWLARIGIAAAGGELKPHGAVWSAAACRDVDAGAPAPWPAAGFDVDEWYENLPDASNDLLVRYRTETDLAVQ
jgi:hypothetical protein